MEEVKREVWNPERAGKYSKGMKTSAVYGPVNSRRLGLSLGVNPIQGGFACNWSCSYCQYGIDDITEAIAREDRGIKFAEVGEIEKALGKRLQSSEHFDSITICGPTEPTLHPQFDDIVDITVEMRDRYRPDIKTSLFTNATRLRNRHLKPLDYVFLKLDAGNEETFRRFNRAKGVSYDEHIDELTHAPVDRKIIQTMIVGGEDGNSDPEHIEDYIRRLQEIKPEEVHLYSIVYQPRPEFDIQPVTRIDLNNLAEMIKKVVPTNVLTFFDPVEMGREFRF